MANVYFFRHLCSSQYKYYIILYCMYVCIININKNLLNNFFNSLWFMFLNKKWFFFLKHFFSFFFFFFFDQVAIQLTVAILAANGWPRNMKIVLKQHKHLFTIIIILKRKAKKQKSKNKWNIIHIRFANVRIHLSECLFLLHVCMDGWMNEWMDGSPI